MPPAHRRPKHEAVLVLRTISQLRRLAAATTEWQRTQMEAGFTVNQALVLHHLVKHGDATPSDLADWMQVSRGSVTPTIQRLEELGLITRHDDPEDGRKQWLKASAAAREIADEVEEKVLRPVFRTFADWSARDLERFGADLERVLASPVLGGNR